MLKPLMDLVGLISSPARRVVKVPSISVNPRTGRITVDRAAPTPDTVRVNVLREGEGSTTTTASAVEVDAISVQNTFQITGVVKKGNNAKFQDVDIVVFAQEGEGKFSRTNIRGNTNDKGEFSLAIPAQHEMVTLVLSHPGFISQEVNVKQEENLAKLQLSLKKAQP